MTAAETVTCACCLRAIVLGKGTSPKRHGWSVQGNRSVGSYGGSWHTGPCEGVRFPHLHESREGADYMIKQLREIRANYAAYLGRVERSEQPLVIERDPGLDNAKIVRSLYVTRSYDEQRAIRAQNASLVKLAAEWLDALCPMDVSVLSIVITPAKHSGYNDKYTARVQVSPGWQGIDSGYDRDVIRFGGYHISMKVPSYAKLREAEMADVQGKIEQLDRDIATFQRAIVEHGW